ncbi:MAG: PEP-CTERM sorting domain-containing protein [Immundisolibacteraceae bacterium]|nr:PEP-CTERM sorting domain-containing protein [Immundisolibacteraceae bacterium]
MKFIPPSLICSILVIHSGNAAAMVATPVSVTEPSSFAILGLGIALFILQRRR